MKFGRGERDGERSGVSLGRSGEWVGGTQYQTHSRLPFTKKLDGSGHKGRMCQHSPLAPQKSVRMLCENSPKKWPNRCNTYL